MSGKCFDILVKSLKSSRTQTIQDYVDRTNDIFSDSTSYREVYKNYDYTTTYGVRIVEDTSAYRKEVVGKKLLMPPDGGISPGDYIHIKDESDTWLVTGYDDLYGERKTAFIQKCGSSKIKWYDANNKLQEWDCMVGVPNSRGGGFVTDRYMVTSTGYLPIVVQSNLHTRKITKNQRFIFGTSVYAVTFIDDFSGSKGNNLIKFELTFDDVMDEDDFDAGIAYNSWANKEYSINILNNDIDGIVGDSFTIDAKVYYNDNETEDELVYTTLDDSIVTVDESGEILLVGTGETQVKVSLVDNDDVYSYLSVNCVEDIVDNHYITLSASSGTVIDNSTQHIDTILQTTPEITISSWLNGETYSDTYEVEVIDGNSNFEASLDNNTITLTLKSVGSGIIRVIDGLENNYDYTIIIKTLF